MATKLHHHIWDSTGWDESNELSPDELVLSDAISPNNEREYIQREGKGREGKRERSFSLRLYMEFVLAGSVYVGAGMVNHLIRSRIL